MVEGTCHLAAEHIDGVQEVRDLVVNKSVTYRVTVIEPSWTIIGSIPVKAAKWQLPFRIQSFEATRVIQEESSIRDKCSREWPASICAQVAA
jgi:hypothetical protein